MLEGLDLVATLKLALKQLEAAGLQAGPDSEDARRALRKLIEGFQRIKEAQPYDVIEWLEKTWLAPKGMLVLVWVRAQNVRDILEKNGFEGLSQVVRDDPLLDLMAVEIESELGRTAREIAGKIEREGARNLVERVGLEWSELKAASSTTSESAGGA